MTALYIKIIYIFIIFAIDPTTVSLHFLFDECLVQEAQGVEGLGRRDFGLRGLMGRKGMDILAVRARGRGF